jgi:hypothetical protein
MWKNQLASRKKEAIESTVVPSEGESKCTCKEHYDLRQCVLKSYSIAKVCKQDIYDQEVVERIGTDNICAPEFDGFFPNDKRWSLYWDYSINVLNVRGKMRRPLPPCFVTTVHDLYPEPSGVAYTGYAPANLKHKLEQLPGTLSNKKFKSRKYDDKSSNSGDSSDSKSD